MRSLPGATWPITRPPRTESLRKPAMHAARLLPGRFFVRSSQVVTALGSEHAAARIPPAHPPLPGRLRIAVRTFRAEASQTAAQSVGDRSGAAVVHAREPAPCLFQRRPGRSPAACTRIPAPGIRARPGDGGGREQIRTRSMAAVVSRAAIAKRIFIEGRLIACGIASGGLESSAQGHGRAAGQGLTYSTLRVSRGHTSLSDSGHNARAVLTRGPRAASLRSSMGSKESQIDG